MLLIQDMLQQIHCQSEKKQVQVQKNLELIKKVQKSHVMEVQETGIDCSGFTQAIYRHFGYSIPRTSGEQRSAGKKVSWSNKKPGDLICYYGHVAIYAGNNTVVHASSKKTGIKTTSPANYRSVASVRRIVK